MLTSHSGVDSPQPTLLISAVILPNFFSVASTSACCSASAVTSVRMAIASRPVAFCTAAATFSAFSRFRSLTTTLAPACASTCAVAPPMAPPAPVMMTAKPSRLNGLARIW